MILTVKYYLQFSPIQGAVFNGVSHHTILNTEQILLDKELQRKEAGSRKTVLTLELKRFRSQVKGK